MTLTLYVIEVRTGPRKWEPTNMVSRTRENANDFVSSAKAGKWERQYRVRRYVRAK